MNKSERIEKSNKDLQELKSVIEKWANVADDKLWYGQAIHIFNELKELGWRKTNKTREVVK